MDHPAPTITTLAPTTSTPVKVATRSAVFLEHHLGAVVAACAGVLAEAVQEFNAGRPTRAAKMRNADFIYELYKLRQFMIADFPDFDRIARERGVEALRACDVPLAAANMLVDAVLERDQADRPGLAQRVLHRGPAHPGPRRYRIEMQRAGTVPANLVTLTTESHHSASLRQRWVRSGLS